MAATFAVLERRCRRRTAEGGVFADASDLNAVRSFKTAKGNLFTKTGESTSVPLVTNLPQVETNN
jgi:hypothetical protein